MRSALALTLAAVSCSAPLDDVPDEATQAAHHCRSRDACSSVGCGTAVDACGRTVDCGPCPIDSGTPPPPPPALPPPWQSTDVGATPAGAAAAATGTFTLTAGGPDIYGSSDGFRFVYQPVTGDVTIVAHVTSLNDTSPWAKAGVMVRETLDASSRFALAALWPSSGAFLEWRDAAGGAADNGAIAPLSPPYWLELKRSGSTFTAFASPDGVAWVALGQHDVPMGAAVYVGLAATSHDVTVLASASFASVAVTVGMSPPPPPPPPSGWVTGYWYPNGWVQPADQIPWAKYTHVVHKQLSTNAGGSLNLPDSTFFWNAPAGFNVPDFVAAGHAAGKQALWGMGYDCSGFINSATSAANVDTLVANMARFTVDNGYDGVELDWECNVDVTQYEAWIRKLRAALPGKTIIMALAENEQATVAAAVAPLIDQANLMCYDEYGPDHWYNAAIYGDVPGSLENSCDLALRRVTGQTINWTGAFTSPGVPVAKIGAGIPFYGYRFTGCTHALDPACRFAGATSYRELALDPMRWQAQYRLYDTTYKSNYLSIATLAEYDSYTDTQYVRDFVAWGRAHGVGGFMTFTTPDEYLAHQVGDARYPLSTALEQALQTP